METRKTEKRYVTSDPKKMLNMYLAKSVVKTWNEEFEDESTGEKKIVERSEILFREGELISQDLLARIRFSMEADGIKEVEVSNQKRLAKEMKYEHLWPYMAQVRIGKKVYKFLLYATSMDKVLEIVRDFIELNYAERFIFMMQKFFGYTVILTDEEENLTEEGEESKENEDEDKEEKNDDEKITKKFYEIDVKIAHGEDWVEYQSFVVETFNIDRALTVITEWLKKEQDERKKVELEKGLEFDEKEIRCSLESAKPIAISRFIPKEFSMAYKD